MQNNAHSLTEQFNRYKVHSVCVCYASLVKISLHTYTDCTLERPDTVHYTVHYTRGVLSKLYWNYSSLNYSIRIHPQQK